MTDFARFQTIEEIEGVLKKFDTVFNPALSSLIGNFRQYAQKLNTRAIVEGLMTGNIILGFYAVYANDISKKEAYLTQIVVAPEFQKHGVGTALLMRCESVTREAGMLSIRLEVNKKNDRGVLFYRKNGYHILATEETACSYYMGKSLICTGAK